VAELEGEDKTNGEIYVTLMKKAAEKVRALYEWHLPVHGPAPALARMSACGMACVQGALL
jgi:hypothetical protein